MGLKESENYNLNVDLIQCKKAIEEFKEGKPFHYINLTGYGEPKNVELENFKWGGRVGFHIIGIKCTWMGKAGKSPLEFKVYDSYKGSDNRFNQDIYDLYRRLV